MIRETRRQVRSMRMLAAFLSNSANGTRPFRESACSPTVAKNAASRVSNGKTRAVSRDR
jgi:hypothetical protein